MTLALVGLAILFVAGISLRSVCPPLRWLHLPTSVIAGFLGLGIAQTVLWTCRSVDPPLTNPLEPLVEQWKAWPGWLIAVVFAAMLLGKPPSKRSGWFSQVRREGLMVWIIVLGQTAVGSLLIWISLCLGGDSHPTLAMLIETGFAGGHGTAGAMGEVYASPQIGLTQGRDLGIMMATIGLVYGIVSGVGWANLGIRRGWTQQRRRDDGRGAERPLQRSPEEPLSSRDDFQDAAVLSPAAAAPRTDLEKVLVNGIWLTLAMGIGLAISWGIAASVQRVEQWIDPVKAVAEEGKPGNESASEPPSNSRPIAGSPNESKTHAVLAKRLLLSEIFGSFPLFIYTLLGGWLVRRGMTLMNLESWIDPKQIASLSAVAMDILVVSAIASMNIEVVRGHAGILAMMVGGAAVWTAFCLLVLSQRVLPGDHWFELGLINYGMSTGTTATGFVLLRMVDPEIRSGAAQTYALAAPLSAPFVGGGILTVGIPLFLLTRVPVGYVAIGLLGIVTTLVFVGLRKQHESE